MSRILIKCVTITVTLFLLFSCFVKKHDGELNKTNSSAAVTKYDFSKIDKAIKGKRIVALGESSHGIGEFYALKSALVEHMHKELGFEVFALEAGYGDINLAWSNIDTFSGVKLRDQSVFGNYQCEEIKPLFEYIVEQSKTKNPLIYAGFDPQLSSSYFSDVLDSILNVVDPGMRDSLRQAFNSYYKIMPSANEPDSANFIYHRDKFVSCIEEISDLIVENQSMIASHFGFSDQQLSIIQRTVSQLPGPVNFSYKNRYNSEYIQYTIVERDVIMFENLKYLIDEVYPDKKFVIWGHNGHVNKIAANQLSTKWMGNYLNETYGSEFYSMGIFAYQGEAYQHWTGEAIIFENAEANSIESKLWNKDQNFSFVDFLTAPPDWSSQELQSLELENGGAMSFTPSERFDGVLGIPKASSPTFNKK